MHGNANEWCSDWWTADTYKDALTIDPTGPASGEKHVTRGGYHIAIPAYSRSAYRSFYPKYEGYAYRGFRVVCVTPAMTAAKFIAPPGDAKTKSSR